MGQNILLEKVIRSPIAELGAADICLNGQANKS